MEPSKNDKFEYELGATLGRGTYSEVLLARRKSNLSVLDDALATDVDSISTCSSPDVVAVKRISKSRLITSEERQMPQREIEVHETIGKHPNAVYMFDSYEDDKSIFLVLEMVNGGTVEEKLKKNPLGLMESHARDIIFQLLQAVEHVHSCGLVHVDISPKNILIDDKTDTVKLCDFGMAQISRSMSNSSMTSTFSSSSDSLGMYGTHGYAAPEVSAGTLLDEKADMWSIGMVCYELLTGVSPHNLLSTGDITFPDEIWQGKEPLAADFTKSLLKVNPVDRPCIGEALAHGWFSQA